MRWILKEENGECLLSPTEFHFRRWINEESLWLQEHFDDSSIFFLRIGGEDHNITLVQTILENKDDLENLVFLTKIVMSKNLAIEFYLRFGL